MYSRYKNYDTIIARRRRQNANREIYKHKYQKSNLNLKARIV